MVGWPPADHLGYRTPTTHQILPNFHNLPTTYWPPTNHLLYQTPTDHQLTTYWPVPPTKYLPNTYQLLYLPTTFLECSLINISPHELIYFCLKCFGFFNCFHLEKGIGSGIIYSHSDPTVHFFKYHTSISSLRRSLWNLSILSLRRRWVFWGLSTPTPPPDLCQNSTVPLVASFISWDIFQCKNPLHLHIILARKSNINLCHIGCVWLNVIFWNLAVLLNICSHVFPHN